MAWTAVAGAAVGGLLGGGGSSSSSTSNKIDDRLAPYVYGKDGKGGLLGDVQKLYQQQFAQGGLNDLQRGGLEMQRQTLMSPQFTQGYDAMRSMGLGLMGGGVAGNPFTSGGMGGGMGGNGGMAGSTPQGPAVVRPTTNTQYTPMQYSQNPAMQAMNTPIQSVSQYQAAQPAAPAAPSGTEIDDAIDAYMKANGLGKYAGQQLGINGQPFFDGA